MSEWARSFDWSFDWDKRERGHLTGLSGQHLLLSFRHHIHSYISIDNENHLLDFPARGSSHHPHHFLLLLLHVAVVVGLAAAELLLPYLLLGLVFGLLFLFVFLLVTGGSER